MPRVRVLFFREGDATVPVLGWLDSLPSRAQDKCVVRIERLAELGHELRRPEAAYLRDGIYELRAKHARVNYRLLYYFHGKNAAVITNGFAKQRARVPGREIDTAVVCKQAFEADPERHTHEA